ncbi:M10 family metallopeptidase C-terminal domain-containing protein [Roseobacter sp. N2S]|uniref:M10 family metallopeptidase C-terminal domain-containing protein n=1 Tax=Roseobacter sp. N2S TaxID=2663844 RepID=UPI0028557B19|nr:M10 family metallopeptidase C-terminal domain-containing protein [Roseobacter sp. N2S]MDR6264583.1 Ca2+-binding RTX toxin-like protein [Roseobacter sp. N2S]
MAAGSELLDFKENLTETKENVIEVRSEVKDIKSDVKLARQALEYVEKIEDQADDFGKQVDAMLLTVKVMSQAGPFKLVAKVAKSVLEKVKTVADKLEEKAHDLKVKIEEGKYIEKLKKAEEKLSALESKLLRVAIKVDAVEESTEEMIDTFDTVDDLDGPDLDTLKPLSDTAETFTDPLNDVLEGLNGTYDDIKAELDDFTSAFQPSGLNPLVSVAFEFRKISDSLGFLKAPLNIVYSALKPIEPILDAVGFIFKITVEPVLNFILDKTGINDLLDAMAEKISEALPDIDVLNGIESKIDAIFAKFGQLGDLITVDGWDLDLDGLLDDLLDKVFEEFGNEPTDQIIIGSAGADDLTGTEFADVINGRAGNDTITANGGDDLIFATAGNDTIYGGAGDQDRMRFSGDLSEYSFFRTEDLAGLVFFHQNPSNSYRTNGYETVFGVEDFYFGTDHFTYDDLIENVKTAISSVLDGTQGNDFLYAGNFATTINGLGGDDRITGSQFDDTFYGGNGDDVFISKRGADVIYGGAGNDTWLFPTDPSGNSLTLVDLATGDAWDGREHDTLYSIENVIMRDNRDTELRGNDIANKLVGNTGDDYIDGKGGDDQIFGGDGKDVLAGGLGQDSLYGGDGFDKLVGGGTPIDGKGDFFDGGEGGDWLTYSSSPISYGSFKRSDSQPETDSLRIYGGTGRVERLDASGTTVLATDSFIGISKVIGSDRADTLYGASNPDDLSVMIDGGGGDDILYSNGAPDVNGGAGDDLIYLTLPENLYNNTNFDGGGGFDTLDTRGLDDVRFYLRKVGAIGSSFRGFDASESSALGVEDDLNESYASQLFSGTLNGIDVLHLGDLADEVQLLGNERMTIYGGGGNDVLIRDQSVDGSTFAELYGGAGDDYMRLKDFGYLYGGAGSDTMVLATGGSGNDMTANGGADDDYIQVQRFEGTITGGAGYDRIFFDLSSHTRAPKIVTVDLQAGTIVADGENNEIHAEVAGFEELIGNDYADRSDKFYGTEGSERFLGLAGADTLDGRGGADQLFGGQGSDRLYGGDGDDLLHGGGGTDSLYGGAGQDTASYATAAPNDSKGDVVAENFGAITANLQLGTVTGTHGTDRLFDIENLTGSSAGDTITGSSERNALTGGAGDDLLYGGDGNDALNVGIGNDFAYGGAGDDSFSLDEGDNSFFGGTGHDTLVLGSNAGEINLNFAQDRYTAALRVNRPAWQDTGDTEARVFDGVALTPQDVLETERLFADAASDLTIALPDPDDAEAARFQIKLNVVTSPTFEGSFDGVEHFVGGTGQVNLNMWLADGQQSYDGSAGRKDVLDFSAFETGLSYNMRTGETDSQYLEGDSLSFLDKIKGSRFDDSFKGDGRGNEILGRNGADKLVGYNGKDQLFGGAQDDRLFGGKGKDKALGGTGDDLLSGGAGNDLLRGDKGRDLLNGNSGDDLLMGGKGGDRLNGGGGHDTLIGGAGREVMTGGKGADVFAFNSPSDSTSSSIDKITDFGRGRDVIDLSKLEGTFTFLHKAAFTGAGKEVNFVRDGGDTIVQIDSNGDGLADMKITLNDFGGLNGGDFIL